MNEYQLIISTLSPLAAKSSLVLQISGNNLVDHATLKVDITDENGAVIQGDVSLKGSEGASGIFQTDIDTPSQKFKVLLKGTTKKGFPFQRVAQSSFEAFEAAMATISAGNEFTASAAKGSAAIKVYFYNQGATQTYSFSAESTQGSVSASQSSMSMSSGRNSTASFTFNLPSNAKSLVGKTANIAITARGQSSGKKVQAAFSMLIVP